MDKLNNSELSENSVQEAIKLLKREYDDAKILADLKQSALKEAEARKQEHFIKSLGIISSMEPELRSMVLDPTSVEKVIRKHKLRTIKSLIGLAPSIEICNQIDEWTLQAICNAVQKCAIGQELITKEVYSDDKVRKTVENQHRESVTVFVNMLIPHVPELIETAREKLVQQNEALKKEIEEIKCL